MLARLETFPGSGLAWLKLLTVIMGAVAVAGCSSSGVSRVQTWEGSAVSGTAVLEAPATIKVREVNGREVGNFLMEDLALDYDLAAGTNTVVFTHKTIWAKSGSFEKDESAVHTVETAPQQVVINAVAGETYRFDVPEVGSRREAQRLADNFRVQVLNEEGRQVARSEPFRGYESRVATSSRSASPAASVDAAPVQAAGATSTNAAPVMQERLETLDALKVLWERASGDEKRAFLRWAFD